MIAVSSAPVPCEFGARSLVQGEILHADSVLLVEKIEHLPSLLAKSRGSRGDEEPIGLEHMGQEDIRGDDLTRVRQLRHCAGVRHLYSAALVVKLLGVRNRGAA